MSKQKSLKGKLAKIFSKKDSSSAGSFNKQSPSASSPRRSLHEVETVSLFGDNEFSSVDPVLFHENAELSNVETRSLGFESGTTTSGRIRRNKSWSFRRPFTPFRTLLPNSSSLSLEFSSSLESGGDGAEEEQGVSLKDKKHDKPGQWAVLSRKKNKREVRQDTAEADGAGTCPDRRGVAPNTSVAKRIRNLLDRGGINRRSQSDRSGNQQSQSDGGDNQQSQSDRGGNQRPQSDRGGNQRPQSDRGGNQRPQSDRGGNQLSQSDRGGNQRPQSDRGGNQRPQSDRGGDQRSQSDSMNPNESASKSFSCDEASSELDDHSIRAGRSLDSAEGLGVSQSCPVGDTLKGNSGDQVLEQDGVSANPLTESDHDVFCDCDESTDSVSYKPLDTLVKPSSQSTVKAAHVDRGPEHSGQWSRCEADTRRLQSDGGNAGGRIKRNFSNYRSERKSKKHSDDETSKSDTFPRERRRNQDKAPKMSVSELIKSFEQASRKMSTENFTGKEFASQGGSRREAAPHLSRNKNVSRSFKSKAEVQGVDDTFVLKEQVEVREEDGGLTGVGVDASSQEKTAPAPPANDATRGSVRHLKQEEEEEEETAHRGAFSSIDQGNSTPTHTHAGVKQHQEIELPGSHGDHLDFKSTIVTPSECDCTDGLNVSDRSTQLTPKDGTTRGVRQEDRIDGQRIDIHKASDASPIGESVDWADSSSPSPKKVKVLAEGNDEMHNLECSSTLITQKFNQDTKTNGNVPENHFSRESEAEQGEALPVSRKRREGTASHSKSYSGLEVPARTARPDGQTKNDTAPSIGVIPNEPARENEHEEISTSLETSGGAPAHRAESSSNTEDGMKVTSIVQPKISRSQEKEKECNLPVSTSAGSSIMEFPKTEDLQTNVDKMMTEPNNADDEVSPSAVSRFGRKVKESESEMVPDNPGEMAKLLDVLNNMDDTENPIPYRKGAKVGPRRNPAWPKDQFLYPIREDSFLETLLEKNAKAGLQPKLNVTPKNEHGSQTLSTQCDKSESYSRARPSITSTRTKLAKRPPREFKYGSVGPQSSPSKNMGLLKEHDDGESQAFNDHPEEGYLQEYREMDQGTCEDHPMEGHLQEYREMDQGTCEVNVPSQLCKCTRHEDSYSLVGPRPGKIVLFEGPGRDGCRFEAWGDEPDCSQWKIRGDACLQVLRGCWIIYEKPDFQGQMAALEEGVAELAQLWGSGMPDATVGSLSLTVRNHSLPAILLFPEEHSRGRFTRYEQEESMLRISTYSPGPASITVYSGTWLLYPRPHFEGCPLVLEPGFYPTRNSWGADHCSVASLRPMVMGGLKVEHPNDFKIVVYDNVEFSGANIEVFSERSHLNGMSMLSARVYGGVWVGYEEEGFEGRQFLLEEGMFSCYQCWGGRAIGLRSLRPLQYDFSSSFALLSEPETFSESKLLECDGDVISVQEHDIIPHSVHIVAGIWVVYEMEGFCGRQYVLEKGLYHHLSDLGSELRSIGSLRPIRKVHTGSAECSFKVEIFGESDQPGSRLKLHDDCPQIPSQEGGGYLRVHAGRWVAYSAEKFTGSMAVLEPGDAASLDMLIPGSYVHSLRVLPYEFSEPELMLYDRSGLCGRQMSISEDTRSLSAIGYNQPQSILVTGGIWVACEHLNFQGRQLLLEEGDVLNLSQLCGWTGLGSLYHLKQPMVLFCLRSIGVEGVLTVMGTATEATAAQVQVQPYDGSDDQNWVYDQGYLRSQVGDLCLEVMGSRWQPGASVGAWFPQQQLQQKWRIMRDGLIVSLLGSNLVLSVKDGGGYDSNHVALAERQENEPWQRWKVEMV